MLDVQAGLGWYGARRGTTVRGGWPGLAGLMISLNPPKGGRPRRMDKIKPPLTRELSFSPFAALVRNPGSDENTEW